MAHPAFKNLTIPTTGGAPSFAAFCEGWARRNLDRRVSGPSPLGTGDQDRTESPCPTVPISGTHDPEMGTAAILSETLFGRTRGAVLAVLYGHMEIGGHDTYSPTYSFRQTADALKENRIGEIRVLIEPPAFRRSTPFQERRVPAQAFRQSARSSQSP